MLNRQQAGGYNQGTMPLTTHPQIASTPLDRPALTRGLALLALVSLILFILGGMIWRNLQRLDTIQAYVSYSHQIQQAGLDLQQALVDVLEGKSQADASSMTLIAAQLNQLAKGDAHFSADTPARLLQVKDALQQAAAGSGDGSKTELFKALRTMHAVLDKETDQRETVLEEIGRDTLGELEMATIILTLIMILTWAFLKRRILTPLHDLKQLLLNLAQEDYSPIETRGIEPLLMPVFNSYNLMVGHLAELEETKRMHAQSLEAEVRLATTALLEQQRSLARAERLAAIGELAASLAHELRNPLAGIQMSCANLRDEVGDPEHVERLELIGGELKRMTRLLNNLLEQGKQTPIPPTRFNLATVVHELLALTRYQIPPHVQLHRNIGDDMNCYLPEANLRQVLLNLILNAAQALDETPGDVTLSAHREGDTLHVSVTDNGPGFSEDMLAFGIRSFNSERPCGTGLGLAMVQRFVRDLGGQIKLENAVPHGAKVTLMLPQTKMC